MIICKNCGAEYDDEQDRCPYCGGDNFGKSVQVHEDMMNELKREKRQWVKKNGGRKCRKKWLAKECRGQQSLG